MRLPAARGPISSALVTALRTGRTDDLAPPGADDLAGPGTDVWGDDVQLALWVAYELHYRGFDDAVEATASGSDPEWDPAVLAFRAPLERAFEAAVREAVAPALAEVPDRGDVAERLGALVEADDGPPLSRHLQRKADREQLLDFLRERSLYHLKESDPSAFVLGRVDGRPKVALAELLYDEYGSGRPHRLHSLLYAEALRTAGLDASYGAYLAETSAATLASNNVMSLFALHHRLRGAALGHLAAFEATSTDPCRRIAAGIERIGLGDAVADYFHEHVEADAVHEQVVLGDICGALVQEEPDLLDDVLLGAAACLVVDGAANRVLMEAWGVLEPAGPAEATTATTATAAPTGPTLVPSQREAGAHERERVA